LHPVLFRFGPELALSVYGILVAAAFAGGLYLVGRSGPRYGISQDQVLDFGFWMLVSTLAGARLLFLVVHWRLYADACSEGRCLEVLKFWKGGLVFYGGLLGAIAGSIVYARRAKIPYLLLADVAAPSVAIGHAIGRIGCFFAGCCQGRAGGGLLGVSFPRGSGAWVDWVREGMPRSVGATPPLHPAQLYEVFFDLILFFVLLRVKSRKRFHGQAIVTYLLGYAGIRFLLEVVRADADRGFVLRRAWPALSRALGLPPADPVVLSTSQAISLLIAAGATIVLLRVRRSSNNVPRTTP